MICFRLPSHQYADRRLDGVFSVRDDMFRFRSEMRLSAYSVWASLCYLQVFPVSSAMALKTALTGRMSACATKTFAKPPTCSNVLTDTVLKTEVGATELEIAMPWVCRWTSSTVSPWTSSILATIQLILSATRVGGVYMPVGGSIAVELVRF